MATARAWTIKGVSDRTRDAAHEAAQAEGLTVGEWIDKALARAAEETLHPKPPAASRADVAEVVRELLREELARLGFGCTVIEHVSRISKEQRILDAFDPLLAAAALHAHADVWHSPFIEEMREWRPCRSVRDDGLDAVSGCLLAEPVSLPE